MNLKKSTNREKGKGGQEEDNLVLRGRCQYKQLMSEDEGYTPK